MLARRFKIPLLKAALKSTAGWKTAKKNQHQPPTNNIQNIVVVQTEHQQQQPT